MKSNWHECLRPDRSAAKLCISINARGEIAMNHAAWTELGRPWLVGLLYDPDARRIGIRGVRPGTRNAFPVRSHGTSGARVIRARRLLKQFSIEMPRTVRFRDPRLVAGIWALDLGTAVSAKAGP